MKIKKWHIVVIVLLLLGVFFMSRGNGGVAVTEISMKDRVVKRTVSASGVVTSENNADLGFASLGRLSQISVDKGSEVTKGTYLAALESFPESQTTQAVKDARDVALRDVDLYIENYSTNLDGVGGLDEYNIGLRRLQELANKAEATYQAQLGTLGRMYLYAPFDGTVVDVYKEAGETALAGETLVKLANLSELVFEVGLDQEDFGFLEIGQEVEITLDAFEDEVFAGIISELPNYVDTSAGNDFLVEITITGDNKDKVLLGMTGDAFIVLSKTAGPVSALTFDEVQYDLEDKPFVYIIQNDVLEKAYIEIGLQGDIYTEVKSNIENPIVKSIDDKTEFEEGMKVKLNGQ